MNDAAASRFAGEGLDDRCKLLAADLRNNVPAGAGRPVLPDTGRMLVIEFVLPDVVDHADPELEYRLMSDINMLAVTGGKERSAVELEKLLSRAGFQCQRIVPVPDELVSIIEAARSV